MTTEERGRINEVIPELTPPMRTAFAIGCFERTVPLVDWYFGPNQEQPVRRAIDLCWEYAESGVESKSDVEESIEHFAALADSLYDNDEDGSPYLFAINALYWALQSMIAPEAKVVQTSVGFASDAAAAEDEPELLESNVSEETAWQMRALGLARAAAQPRRDMFHSLSTTPKWLERFRARHAP